MENRRICAMRGRMPLKQERSEYGKQILKDYEGGTSKHREQTYSSLKSARMECAVR